MDIDDDLYIIPSWYPVIRFLCSSESGDLFLKEILNIYKKNNRILDFNFSNYIPFSSKNRKKILKKQLFKIVYESYRDVKRVWFPIWARYGLDSLLDSSDNEYLKEEAISLKNKHDYIAKGNFASIIRSLLQYNPKILKGNIEFWKKIFIDYANSKFENGVLNRTALSAIQYFKDQNLLKQLDKDRLLIHEDELVCEAYIKLVSELSPNGSSSVELFVSNIDSKSINVAVSARFALKNISTSNGFKFLWLNLLKKLEYTDKFIQYNNRNIEIVEKFKNSTSKDSLLAAKDFIFYACKESYHASKSDIIIFLGKLLLKKDLLSESDFEKVIKEKRDIHQYRVLIALTLTPENSSHFEKIYSSIGEDLNEAYYSLLYTKSSIQNIELPILLKKFKLHLEEEEPTTVNVELQQNQKVYKEFQSHLNHKSREYNPTIFAYYIQNRKIIDKQLKEEDKNFLESIIKKGWLSKIDPQNFTFAKGADGSYETSAAAPYWCNVMRITSLWMASDANRLIQKIVDFIPFAYSEDIDFIVSEILGTKEPFSWDFVDSSYQKKKNIDLRHHLTDSYTSIIRSLHEKKYKFGKYNPCITLKIFVEDKKILIDYRRSALELLSQVKHCTTKDYMKRIFKKYSSSQKDISLSDLANEILVTKYKDEEAISWRFKAIKDRATTFVKPKGAHWISPVEDEYRSKKFIKPLFQLGDRVYSEFQKLLKFSHELPKEKDFEEYQVYIKDSYLSYIGELTLKSGNLRFLNESIGIFNRKKDFWAVYQCEEILSKVVDSKAKLR
jgi:hypothetical protein